MDVELRHLRAFVAVAQGLSFTRAAEQLFVTQPALTRTIKQLEGILGVSLLDRDTRRVNLTPEGVRFLEGARAALGAVDRAVSNVFQDAPLRLGFSWLLPDPWAQRAVAEYERTVQSSVSLVRTDDPVGGLERREIDVAVLRDPVDLPDRVRTVRLFQERRVVVCSTASAIAERQSVDWSELDAWPFVYNSVSGTVGPWSWREGGPTRFVETHNYDEWLESIAADRGISVVPDLATRRTIHPSICFVPLAGAPSTTVSIGFVLDHPERLKRRFAQAAVAVVDPTADGY